MYERVSTQALTGRARGIIAGSLIALGWAAFGLSGFNPSVRNPLLAVASALTAILLISGIYLERRAHLLPNATPSQVAAGKKARRWFWLNLAGEIVLLNIAINLLAAPTLHIYWVPAISAVVGLHFWPMAQVFRVRSYWWVGSAMMAGAALTAYVETLDAASALAFANGEAIANALILWSALGIGAARARRDSSVIAESGRQTDVGVEG
jgi:hypothetical protein